MRLLIVGTLKGQLTAATKIAMDRGAGVVLDAAGDNRDMDVLELELFNESADVDGNFDHQQIGALAGAQHRKRLVDRFGVGDGGAAIHRDLGRGGKLALERANDQKSHGSLLS